MVILGIIVILIWLGLLCLGLGLLCYIINEDFKRFLIINDEFNEFERLLKK